MSFPGGLSAPQSRLRGAAVWVSQHPVVPLAPIGVCLLVPEWLPVAAASALALVPLLWLLRWATLGSPVQRTMLDWPIAGLMATVLVGVWAAPDKSLVVPKLCSIVLGVASYYALAHSVASAADGRLLAGALSALSVAVAAISLFGADWHSNKVLNLTDLYQYIPRIVPLIPRSERGGFHPNQVGGVLACLAPFSVALTLWGRAPPPGGTHGLQRFVFRVLTSRPFGCVAATVSCAVLVLTQSKAAIGAASAAIFLLLLKRTRWGLLAIPLVLVSGGAYVLGQGPGEALTRFASGLHLQTMSTRLAVWTAALKVVAEYPFTGVGLANFEPVVRFRYAPPSVQPSWPMTHAHNIFLQMVADVGIPGLLCFVVLMSLAFASAFRSVRTHRHGAPSPAVLGALSGFCAYVLWSLTDAFPLGNKPGTVLWVLLALLVGRSRAEQAGRPRPLPADARLRTLRNQRRAYLALLCALALLSTPVAAGLSSNLGRVESNLAVLSPGATPNSAAPHLRRAASLLRGSLLLIPDDPSVSLYLRQAERALANPEMAIRWARLRCGSFCVDWQSAIIPGSTTVGSTFSAAVTFANCGLVDLLASGPQRTMIGHRWLYRAGGPVQTGWMSSRLPMSVLAGETASLTTDVRAPDYPGMYTLRFTLLPYGLSSLASMGCTTLDVSVNVLTTR